MELLNGLWVLGGAVVVGIVTWLKFKLDRETNRADKAENEVKQTRQVIENVQKRQDVEQANATDTRSAIDRLRKDWSRD